MKQRITQITNQWKKRKTLLKERITALVKGFSFDIHEINVSEGRIMVERPPLLFDVWIYFEEKNKAPLKSVRATLIYEINSSSKLKVSLKKRTELLIEKITQYFKDLKTHARHNKFTERRVRRKYIPVHTVQRLPEEVSGQQAGPEVCVRR